jgi:hypothetical protein
MASALLFNFVAISVVVGIWAREVMLVYRKAGRR